MRFLIYTTFFGFFLRTGLALQIQCYQCEEVKHNDCSTPEFIVNCTVNVQDMCQKEVLVKEDDESCKKPHDLSHCCTGTLYSHICSRETFQCNNRQNDICRIRCGSIDFSSVHYRKSCASSGACLIASSGYQQFCTGKLHSVCISCCNTPLCNGPRLKKRPIPSATPPAMPRTPLSLLLLFLPPLLLT